MHAPHPSAPYDSQLFPASKYGSHESGFGLGPSWGAFPSQDPYFVEPPPKPEAEIFGVPLKLAIPAAVVAFLVFNG